MVLCVSLSSIRFITLDNSDLARVSIPFFFFRCRRNLPVGWDGGDSSSPSRPIPFELALPLVNNELSNEDEKSDPTDDRGLFPSPPIIPSKNEFCASPLLPHGDGSPSELVVGSLAAVPSLSKRP